MREKQQDENSLFSEMFKYLNWPEAQKRTGYPAKGLKIEHSWREDLQYPLARRILSKLKHTDKRVVRTLWYYIWSGKRCLAVTKEEQEKPKEAKRKVIPLEVLTGGKK